MKYLEIKFETHTQPQGDGNFSVPKQVCDLLGIHADGQIHLQIWRSNGEAVLNRNIQMKSGHEVYGEEIRRILGNDEPIIITAKRPE